MTIRSALLRAFFGLVLGATVVMGTLTFFQVRQALQTEIAHNLQFGASAVMQRIDTFLFSQFENLRVWRNVEVMQDLRVGDVDKRLSHFLSDLRAGQGTVYRALLATDESGHVIAASDPARIGSQIAAVAHWQPVPGTGRHGVQIEPVYASDGRTVMLRIAIANAFGHGNIGFLYAQLNWNAIEDLLDKAVGGGPRSLLLLNARGRVIGASKALRDRLDLHRLQLGDWAMPRSGAATYVHDGAKLGFRTLLVGAATSRGYQHFRGLDWRLLMVEPTRVSFRPVWHLLWSMLGLLLLTLGVAVWISARLSARIARPIVGLTEFTRGIRRGDESPPVAPVTTISEVGELHRAYVEMIEALERSREQVVRAGKLAVVGEMAAIMAHEVRTPVGIVRSSAQLLERQAGLGERDRELIGFIVSETERLNRLVTMLLECARPNPPEFRPHDLHEIADNVLNLLASRAEQAGVRLQRDFAAPDAILNCDREQMTQVLLNLVLNALQFVVADGRVRISTRRDGDSLYVVVTDDGPGVSEAMRTSVFDPFFSRREGGIGLGLTIVQQIVQAHGGDIRVDGSEWGGAAFVIHFDTKDMI